MPQKDLPTLPPAADLRRDSLRAGCKSFAGTWDKGKEGLGLETVMLKEDYANDHAV